MNHSIKICLGDTGKSTGIVRCRNVTLRERLLRRLLGNPQRMTIIVPGDSVKLLSIKELGEDNGDGDT
jgi:hypothetical protein